MSQLAPPLRLAWKYQAVLPPSPAWTPPAKQNFWGKKYNLPARVTFDRTFHVTSDGERVFFGSSSDDAVRCLNLATGRVRWTFFTEGPVRLAPAVQGGRVYFGSDDGAVYCVDAKNGKLQWRFRGTPDVRLPGNGRLISLRPGVARPSTRGSAGPFS